MCPCHSDANDQYYAFPAVRIYLRTKDNTALKSGTIWPRQQKKKKGKKSDFGIQYINCVTQWELPKVSQQAKCSNCELGFEYLERYSFKL